VAVVTDVTDLLIVTTSFFAPGAVMTCNSSSIVLPSKNAAMVLSILIISLSTSLKTSDAQSWPVNSPEVYESVPQYKPTRYPLNSKSAVKPPRNASPTNGSSPGLDANPTHANQVRPKQLDSPSTTQQSVPHLGQPKPTPVNTQTEEATTAEGHTNSYFSQNWDAQRDRNQLPVDPRKPCNHCTHPSATRTLTHLNLPGLQGRPYLEREPGGCLCDKKQPPRHSDFSVYWPRPFSLKLDQRYPQAAAARHQSFQKKRIVDIIDPLSKLKISGYKRTDNGYCGPGSDPYGCVGESRYAAQMMGQPVR
jgi:hypothetical protein